MFLAFPYVPVHHIHRFTCACLHMPSMVFVIKFYILIGPNVIPRCFVILWIATLAPRLSADSTINYQITGGNLGAAFDVDRVTGTVTVKNSLDYETTQRVTDMALYGWNDTIVRTISIGFDASYWYTYLFIYLFIHLFVCLYIKLFLRRKKTKIIM